MIKVAQIDYTVKSGISILKNIDFFAEKGQLITILGPNGAGKSTLLSLLANEIGQNKNDIELKSVAYHNWSSKELPKHKAKFSQQNNSDIPLDVKEIVMMGRYPYFENNPTKADQDAIAESMAQTDVFPLQKRAYNSLSGGEKQRVHLARVLAQLENEVEEKILFLDEPLNNLDVLHQHKILNLIKQFTQRGNTAVVVLHDLNLAAQFSDKILLLKKGEKICYDVPEKVLTREIISAVYNFPCTVCVNPVNNNPLIIFGT
ncbi:heme ABC transporter ATP-binding protein [Flavobacterium sp. JP2137]|uniref:heme ABC transporter ATP-binding protein n=1 Tax=Flavobacterium sp. JP2137 TaxID=3414510 RepID=UPI003D2FD9A1